MCWECDHPGSSHQDYLDYMQDLIGRFGWAVAGIESDRIHPARAYTLGLTPHGKPELAVTGLPLPRATWLLNAVAPYVLHTTVPQPGQEVLVEGDLQVAALVFVADLAPSPVDVLQHHRRDLARAELQTGRHDQDRVVPAEGAFAAWQAANRATAFPPMNRGPRTKVTYVADIGDFRRLRR